MRKIIIIVAALLSLFTTSQAQFRDRVNIVFYGNHKMEQLNTNTYNNELGIWANWNIFMKDGLTVGPYFSGGKSQVIQNLSQFEGKNEEFGGGFSVGYYNQSILGSEFWGGFSTGVTFGKNKGAVLTPDGVYNSTQKDQVLNIGLNLNFWKSNIYKLLPKLQVQLISQFPLAKEKEAFWNGEIIANDPAWDRTYIELSAKQSIINVHLFGTMYLSPKLVAAYSYAKGNEEKTWSLGSELSLFKQGKGDAISVYWLYEMSNKDKNRINFGAMVSLTALF